MYSLNKATITQVQSLSLTNAYSLQCMSNVIDYGDLRLDTLVSLMRWNVTYETDQRQTDRA